MQGAASTAANGPLLPVAVDRGATTLRGRCIARLEGRVQQLLSRLRRAAGCVDARLSCLRELCDYCSDLECNLEFGFQGGHQLLLRLVAECCDDAEEELLSELTGICSLTLPPELSFPLQPRLECDRLPPPWKYDFTSFLICPTDRDPAALQEAAATECHGAAAACARQPGVWLRTIPAQLHKMRGQEDVGQQLWPAARPFSRWLVAHRSMLAGSSILEIGAGTGLCGITAGLYARLAEAEAGWCETCNCQHDMIRFAGRGSEGHKTPHPHPHPHRLAAAPHALRDSVEDSPGYHTGAGTDHNGVAVGDAGSGAHAAWKARRTTVCLTDFNPRVLHNLQYNAALNAPAEVFGNCASCSLEAVQDAPSASDCSISATRPCCGNEPLFTVRRLDWTHYTSEKGQGHGQAQAQAHAHAAAAEHVQETSAYTNSEGNSHSSSGTADADQAASAVTVTVADLSPHLQFDVVLGSDMICCEADAYGVVATLERHLSRCGTAVFVLPPENARYGVALLAPLLTEAGFCVTTSPMEPIYREPVYNSLAPAAAEKDEPQRLDHRPGQAECYRAEYAGGRPPVNTLLPDGNLDDTAVVAGGYEAQLVMYTVRWKTAAAITTAS